MSRNFKNTVRYHYRGIRAEREIRPGSFYEDCRYHPMVCVENERGDLTGVSLIDGGVSGCSMFGCGVITMTREEALARKNNWQDFLVSLERELFIDG